ENLRGQIVGRVVAAERKQISDLLIETLLRGPNLPNACEQLVEVIPALRVLQSLVIHHESLNQEFPQVSCGPLAELGATRRANAIANRQDQVEVVVGNCSFYLAFSFSLNC